MDTKHFLSQYSAKADEFVEEFFKQQKKSASKISPFCGQMMDIYRDYMAGGKKARGALIYLGYKCAGGKDDKVAFSASIAIEIFHSFLLMHDDWIDKDIMRRGKPTVHIQYEKIFQENKWQGDGSHWAAGMAVILGDSGCFLAYQILNDLEVAADNKKKAVDYLCRYLVNTAYGEALDMTYDFAKDVRYRDILKVRELKTAYYTIVMPLSVGASLAGADKNLLRAIEGFGLPIGIAFQLRDDELGLFGEEKVLGKSILTDLLEGKKTMLILKAVERLKNKDRQILISIWGKKKASARAVEEAKKLIIKSKALEFSQKMSKRLVKKGKKFIPEITQDLEQQDTLGKLADFMIERQS